MVTSRIIGLRGTAGSKLGLRTSHSTDGDVKRPYEVSEAIAVGAGEEIERTSTVRLEKPGYYHVMTYVATTSDEEKREDRQQGVPVAPVATSSIWVLVDEQGGRVDTQYDDAMRTDNRRRLSSGVLGAFRTRAIQKVPGSSENVKASPSIARLSPTVFNGRVTYQFYNPSNLTFQTRTMEGLQVAATCIREDNEVVGYSVVTTNILGEFSVTCPEDQTFQVAISANLQAAGVEVRSHQNWYAGATGAFWVDEYGGERIDFPVNNNEAAQVFKNHVRYNTGASALFGRTRSPITYRVSNSVAGITVYDPAQDIIRIFPDRVWGRDGVSVVAHEYGHAFHFVAIDPWIATGTASSCITPASPSGAHQAGTPYTTGCAYVEGFADFFAARVINVVDGFTAWLDPLSQPTLETNVFRTLGHNGLLDEGAFAALLMDMVDTPSDDDGSPGDDEVLTMSHFDLTQIMRMCRMSDPSTGLLTHSDQFVYCAAGSVGERSFAPSSFLAPWGVYSSRSFDAPTTLPLQSAFRAAWRFDFYNL